MNGKDGSAGSFIGNNTLGTIANCFFLNGSSNFGGTQKSADEFHDGTVAVLLHNYDKNDVNGLVWGQDLTNANSLPDFSSKIGTPYSLILHTFDGDTRKYQTEYVSEMGLELPTDLTRETHVFLGWSTKETAESSADIVTSIAKGETSEMEFYAQWMKVNSEQVFEIASKENLYEFAKWTNMGFVIDAKLVADICLNACGEGKSVLNADGSLNGDGSEFTQWTPIGTETKKFEGTFDGAGHTISGLYFNQDASYAGLFGRSTKGGSIKNVGVVDSYIKGKDYVGGIVGYNGNCTVSNVFSTSTVQGNEYVGGIAGKNDAGTIENAYNMGAVSGAFKVGGIAGENDGTTAHINNVYSSGTVSGPKNKYVYGLVGYNSAKKYINYAFYNTDVFSEKAVGNVDGTNVEGKTTVELASTTLPEGFSSEIWLAGSKDVVDGKLVYKFPGLNIFNSQPELVLFNVQKGSDGKDYCEIANADDLFKFAQLVNGGATGLNAKLTADICLNACGEDEKSLLEQVAELEAKGNLSSESFRPWTPMNVSSNVTLAFDGNGHTISGLYFNKESSADKGLFGQVTGNVSISNLGVVDFYVKGEDRVGSLAGQVTGKLNIENCFSAGSVEGDSYVGGFVGLNRDNAELNIENSYNESSVNASSGAVGGLVGGNYNYASLTIANSYNVGAVSGNDYVGGLVGDNDSGTLNVSNSYNVGVVTASKTIAGGLVGGDEFGTLNISNSFFVETNGDGDTLGGVVKTPDEFANGEVTDLLNTDQSPIVWVQGKEYPILKDNHVHSYENGFCICGNYEQPVQDENGVYLIANAGNLYWFANFVNQGGDNDSANAVLTSDIVVNENVLNDDGSLVTGVIFREWTPIGLYNYDYSQGDLSISYSGKFDGQGHIVSGLYLNNANKDGVGLFGCISDSSSIQNVRIVDSYFYGKDCVGGVCGVNKAEKIKNCFSSATVIGNSMIGGVCGNMQMSSVENCYNIGLVSGNGQVGGVVGYTFNMGGPLAKNCYSAGIVKEKGTLTNKVFGSVQVGYSQNCYYLADTDDGNGSKTAKQFASGEVAYLLSQGENGEVWGQKIGTDNYPCFYNNKVYASTCAGVACEFTNDINATKIYEEHVFDENGFCTRCGAYEPAENSDGVYQIANAGELYWFADFVNQGGDNAKANAILTNNIVVNTLEFKDGEIVTDNKDYKEWNPIGIDDYYQGIFDGNGHTISGLYFNDSDEWYVGLFASNDGTIQNLGVVGSYFYGHQCVGGVCGNNNIGTISNCYNTSTVSGNNNIGGVSGFNFEGKIENCYNTGAVSGLGFVGEVCGSYNDVTNCYYLSDTDDGNGDGVYGKTAEQFANGTVAKLLYDGENGSIWGQNTSTDTVPNFSGKILFKVTLTAENGTAENGLGEYNKKYEIKATANTGYHFVEWSNGSTEIKDSILVVNDTALVATFEAHSFGKWDTTLVATCTTLGMRSHHCSCGAFENDTIAELPHTIVIDTLVPSTCTHWGLKEGSHCSVCKTVLVKQDTIEALGHSFTLYVYNDDATTEADGTKTAACDHEGCDETDTQVAVGTKLEPTLSEKTEGDDFSIYTFGRSIVIENADADINVYDVTGRLVARREGMHSVSERIEVPNIGVYVVKCGNMVKRVSVIQ
ncbi:MAG: InlB B-repeat-containing protein [Paludibacteraceae bacterium]|nr:InlB B-repeat-containing protein [Paludibacteraceae bacterium]